MTPVSVSGVSGVFQVDFRDLTQRKPAPSLTCGAGVSGVSGLTRARACVRIFLSDDEYP